MFKNLFCLLLLLSISLLSAAQVSAAGGKDSASAIRIKTIPPNYYAQHLGIICKGELRLQKATRLPLFFRLGSKNYVDYLEQKPRAFRKLP
jgi:hypothetical protein